MILPKSVANHVDVEVVATRKRHIIEIVFSAYLPNDNTKLSYTRRVAITAPFRDLRKMYKHMLRELANQTIKYCYYTSYKIKFVKVGKKA